MTYGSRSDGQAAPSGGQLTKPIVGQGKLGVGQHRLSVLSAKRVRAGRWDVILADPGNHCHLESVADWPPDLPHGEVDVRIALSPGFAVCRDGGVYYAVDTTTRAKLTDTSADVQTVYDQATDLGHLPCTTQLTEYRRVGSRDWTAITLAEVHSPKASGPKPVATTGAVVASQPDGQGAGTSLSQAGAGGGANPLGLRNNRAGRRRAVAVRRRGGAG